MMCGRGRLMEVGVGRGGVEPSSAPQPKLLSKGIGRD